MVSPTEPNVVYVGGNTFDKVVDWIVNTVNHTQYSIDGSNNYHADTRCAILLQGTQPPAINGANDILFAGNDGGISKTLNGTNNWISLNGRGLNITQFYGIGYAKTDPQSIIGGTQDNSCIRLSSTGWKHSGGGDLGKIITDPTNSKKSYASFWGGGYLGLDTTNNYGATWNSYHVDPNDSSAYCINGPVCLNPKKSSEVYFATHNLFKSYDNGKHFTEKVVPGNDGQGARAIAIATSDTQRIYMAYDQPLWSGWLLSRLFKSTDGGTSWFDITPGCTHFYGITSIEVSPTNADSVWIGFGGFMGQGSWNRNRIMLTTNAGQDWKDYSTGLPNMPVNCLKYKNGSHGGVFAGTDVGVFYIDRTFSDSTWVPLNSALPISVVNDVEFIDTLNAVRVATYGRGIWETDLFPCTYYGNDPLVVNSDLNWVIDTVMDRDIDIKAPAVLRIRCKVKFPINAKIMVEQGAQLIVDGGILTNYCSGMWKGIEVWGDSSRNQLPMYQGSASFINGAIIENARIAITACQKDANGEIIWSTTGGYIGANNSTFKNNYKALEFLEYHHNQNCSFSNDDFISSGNFADHNSHLSDFVSIFKSYGIHFRGCRFQNLNVIQSDTTSQYGRGIYSIDGSYTVDNYCVSQQTPCTQWIPSEFYGLSYGIKALGTMPIYPVYISNSTFYKFHRGIYISGINNVSVNRNSFECDPVFGYSNNYFPHDTLYGLYLDNCTGYSIQENIIYKVHSQFNNLRYIGMIINNSGPEPNEIYNNNISGVKYSIIAQTQNRDKTGLNGLCLKCNDYSITANDEVITSKPFQPYPYLLGIAANQGDTIDPAGNTFATHQQGNGTYDILNTISNGINYYYHDRNSTTKKVEPLEISLNVYKRPTTIRYSKDTSCPSKLNNGGIGKDVLMQELSSEESQLDSLKIVLNSLIDGGSTPSLNSQVQTSIPPDAVQLHQDLLSISPYLSDTVVKLSILKENVLPNEMIRDILVANPASAKSEDVLDKLNQRSNPMPDSLMAEIIAGKDSISSKEILQARITSHNLKKAYALNELIRYFRNDTISPSPTDSIIKLLQADPALESKYKLAFEFLGKQDTSSVGSVLHSINNSFSLTGHDSMVYQNYRTYFNILLSLRSQNKSILQLNSSQTSQLMNIVSNGSEPVQTYARNVLIANGVMDYNEPIILPDETKSQELPKSFKTSKMVQDKYMKLFPNPANHYFIIEYNLRGKFGDKPQIEFSLFSSEGKPIVSRNSNKNQDQILIETRNFENGTYICSMIMNGKILDSEKILIVQ
ncbi:MAG: T9SS type A sorting domain-containing protein [Bacteroidetes bacterium]|nr:T9SS type A sorting domain-containing protein [Bacteroidota bacterium]